MKTIAIGDLHGHDTWKQIVDKHPDANRIIFIGDYVDSFDIPGLEQADNLRKIIEFKETSDKDVILLIGNHDHHYWPGVGYTGTSGYQPAMKATFEYEFETYKDLFQMCFLDQDYIYSHAGITKEWLSYNDIDSANPVMMIETINGLFKHEPHIFSFYPEDTSCYGDHIRQSPIWVRPASLYRNGIDNLQIVGHTPQKRIEPLKSPRQGYYLIDTLGSSGEYLLIEDGKISILKL